MASQDPEDVRTSSNIPTDIPRQRPSYPGKPLLRPRGPSARTSVVEEKTGRDPAILASEQNFSPVASIRYPNKNIHVVPLSNTKRRGVSPVALSGSVTLPVKGENVVDLGDGIRRPLEKRLGRLLESDSIKIAGPSEPPEQPASQQASANVEYVKTELDKLRDLAKRELAKKQTRSRLPIRPVNTRLGSVVEEKPTVPGSVLLPKQPEPEVAPSAAETAQGESNLMGQAQQLEEELKALQRSLLTQPTPRPPQPKQPAPPQAQAQDYYTAQMNQLLKDKTELLNKVNELAIAYQQEAAARKKAEQKLYSVTNDFNIQFANLRRERDELQKRVLAIEQRQTQPPQKQSEPKVEPTTQAQSLKEQLEAAQSEKQNLKSQIQKLEVLVQQLGGSKAGQEEKQAVVRPTEAAREQKAPTARIVKPQVAVGRMAPSLTTAANVINGIVKDAKGMLLSNVILVVKSENGEPVRALKTNKIGQFAISTPLPNGTYMMELESPGHTFDVVQVDVKGRVLPPIEIKSHN